MGKKSRDGEKNTERQSGGTEDAASLLESTDETPAQCLRDIEEEDEEGELLVPKDKKLKLEEAQIVSADEASEVNDRTTKPKFPQKKHKPKGRRVPSRGLRVKIGGRDFSNQRLKAYGLNPKNLFFRQLGRQRRKAQEKKKKAEKV